MAAAEIDKRTASSQSLRDSAIEDLQEWQILWTARPNVLVTGLPAAVEQSLAALMPHLAVPVCDWTPDVLQRRPGEMKTLVIHDVDALSPEHQGALSAWLERPAGGRTQVVSTTNAPLFPRVVAGLFREELYYRLNTLVLGA
ncbi:MAG TPA: hypothetical protein VGY48_21925 [Vicinamibacterales bacterium]|jgi:hypothetical protein|nr:hypothetical protein [Vicinamibacterales bacterium]